MSKNSHLLKSNVLNSSKQHCRLLKSPQRMTIWGKQKLTHTIQTVTLPKCIITTQTETRSSRRMLWLQGVKIYNSLSEHCSVNWQTPFYMLLQEAYYANYQSTFVYRSDGLHTFYYYVCQGLNFICWTSEHQTGQLGVCSHIFHVCNELAPVYTPQITCIPLGLYYFIYSL